MSTPDRTPEQPEPYTPQGPQSPLENEGWGTSDPANPFTEETRTVPWFRRPATLIGGAAVAVVVIVGLVIALLVTGKDAGSTEAGSTAPRLRVPRRHSVTRTTSSPTPTGGSWGDQPFHPTICHRRGASRSGGLHLFQAGIEQ